MNASEAIGLQIQMPTRLARHSLATSSAVAAPHIRRATKLAESHAVPLDTVRMLF
jgi:hypothetical protein